MEDTDEDFFDKLVDDVDDQFNITSSSSGKAAQLDNLNDSDKAKAGEEDDKASSTISGVLKYESTEKQVDPGELLVSSNSFAFDNVNNEPNNGIGMAEQLDSTASGYHGIGGASGVKEVQWSAFTAEPLDDSNNGFGSYSDFFTDFGDNFVDQTRKGDSFVNSEPNSIGNSPHVDGADGYSHQFQEGQSYTTSGRQSTDGQDINSSQYWENLYPGWKYDANTGQWYQVNEGYDATANAQGVDNSTSEWTVSNTKSEAAYLQQTSQSFVGDAAEKGTTESVMSWGSVSEVSHTNDSLSNWSQASQGNNGYPSHMYFDPQYPGWYYDMNAQEWRALDAYNSMQTAHAQDQVDQNGFSATNSYYGNEQKVFGGQGQIGKQSGFEVFGSQGQDYNWNGSFSKQQGSSMWQPDNVNKNSSMSYPRGNQHVQNHYGANFPLDNNVNRQQSYDDGGTASSFNKASQVRNEFPAVSGSHSFVPSGNFSQPFHQSTTEQSEMMNATKAYGNQNLLSYSQPSVHQRGHQRSASTAGRSSAGRPPHALVTFGFGGKLLVMKDATPLINSSYGTPKDSSAGSVSVLNLTEIVPGGADASSSATGVGGYFHALCRQSFPGPLAAGNVGGRELNRWIDERIAHPTDIDYRKVGVLRLLLSLLKIASQHYGKLRSPFGTDTTSKENDAPDVAVARLFASAKRSSAEYVDYGAFTNCLQQFPSEGQSQATAAEVQTLLVSGRKIEALQHAQEGQLWGLALVLAAQLGDQFYVDTVRNMALRQLVAGSPLRTLCLLIAGQPADVFSTDNRTDGGTAGAVNMFPQPVQAQLGANAMLDDWEENLAMITANRTKDDELVLIHLGDCLWKETSNIIAAHICYLVAEANFEPYSDSARLCLIGADHWKHPRTYACPEAIQRTEVYEYSKLLGNSQFTLLPFQPYKLIYAHMLAEVGRVSDSLKYCQSISKSLKTGRAPEVETWRHMISSLEDRIKTYQQGGFSTNLAPGKLVGKLLNLFDSTAHRVVGGLPPPVPSTSGAGAQNYHYHQPTGPRVSASQSTMAMSSLVPSASMEPITQKSAEGNNRRIMHNRSVSEPDFGRSPRQDQVESSKENSADSQSKASGTSRFGRFGFGSQLFQKTVGLVLKPRQDKQAKLGETNKFYYDEKLKRWVEEGVDPPAEEAALPPPPTMATFQNGTSDHGSKSAAKSEGALSNGSLEFSSGSSVGHSSGIPPIPATSSQFSARGRMGVRSRYVDTFNQGGGNPSKLFQSPSASSIKSTAKSNPKFFVPMAVPSAEQPAETFPDNMHHQTTTADENPSPPSIHSHFQSPPYTSTMQRFASMDDISKGGTPSFPSNSSSPRSRRTVSWGGSTDERFSVSSEVKPSGEFLGMSQLSFMPSERAVMPPATNGDSFSDDYLHEVEL
ncbi:protein transport protein SEC16B homolog [Cynara cardunculus var. scolymus]|uniref:protein transport protein SEC16B homolog n=1 Tax=Cynara cardunculus var. scolymus TaxID=59895 RepID=UPI000D62E634|nr:protein transport protein SEC16B homolog [Cynara cardunculus var. scolymus]